MIIKCFGCSYYKAVGYKNTIYCGCKKTNTLIKKFFLINDDFVNHYNISMMETPEWCPINKGDSNE